MAEADVRYMLLMREAEVLMHENEPQRTRRGAAEATHGFGGGDCELFIPELLKAFKYFSTAHEQQRSLWSVSGGSVEGQWRV